MSRRRLARAGPILCAQSAVVGTPQPRAGVIYTPCVDGDMDTSVVMTVIEKLAALEPRKPA